MSCKYGFTVAVLVGASLVAGADPVIDKNPPPIRNYHEVSDQLGTGGTLAADGMEWLAASGYQMIVDLRDELDESEANAALAQGMGYAHVPVSWRSPSADELEVFLLTMASNPEKKILVHCSANYRASAMTYLYRVLDLGADPDKAMADIEVIWEPNETWRRFLDQSMQGNPPK